MKIVVTVKQIPDPNGVQKLGSDNRLVRDGEVVLEPFAPFDSAVARALEDDARDVARFLAT